MPKTSPKNYKGKTSKRNPKGPKGNGRKHPPYKVMVVTAINTLKKAGRKTSRAEIQNFIERNYAGIQNCKRHLDENLSNLVRNGGVEKRQQPTQQGLTTKLEPRPIETTTAGGAREQVDMIRPRLGQVEQWLEKNGKAFVAEGAVEPIEATGGSVLQVGAEAANMRGYKDTARNLPSRGDVDLRRALENLENQVKETIKLL